VIRCLIRDGKLNPLVTPVKALFTVHFPHFPYSSRRHAPPIDGAPALTVRDLAVSHLDSPALALKGITLTVQPGERIALVGPNGAGKSTLLKAIAGLLPIRGGELLIYGLPVGACHHRVAYLPQRGEIDWRFPTTLQQLIMTGRYGHLGWVRRPSPEDWKIVERAIHTLGLEGLAQRQIGQLSGGQQQRAMLARALAQESDLLLLDEPLNAIDKDNREIVYRVIDLLHQAGKTLIVATHDLTRLETDFDRAIYIADGQEVNPEVALEKLIGQDYALRTPALSH